jgi:myo-inositol-1(or 4)-monophosphatase
MFMLDANNYPTKHLLLTVENHALFAASMVRDMLKTEYKVANKKFAGDLATDIDHAVNDFLRKHLTELNPNWGWISEETKNNTVQEFTWVVDPIDGTSHMVEDGNKEFSISIGLVYRGTPVLGVVINPIDGPEGCMISGAKGLGLHLNQKKTYPIFHSEQPRLILSYGKVARKEVNTKLPQIPMGSIAWRMANIAIGEGEVTLGNYPNTGVWDLAAGHALILLTNGKVTDQNGNDIDYTTPDKPVDGLVATGYKLHHEVAMHMLPKS